MSCECPRKISSIFSSPPLLDKVVLIESLETSADSIGLAVLLSLSVSSPVLLHLVSVIGSHRLAESYCLLVVSTRTVWVVIE